MLLSVWSIGAYAGCAERTSCYECMSDYGCAWCSSGSAAGSKGRCHSSWEATASAPAQTESVCNLWHFADAATCPYKPCKDLTSCIQCLSAPMEFVDFEGYSGCGWCSFSNKCMKGNLKSSQIIIVDELLSPAESAPELSCMGKGNWTFGAGRCGCYGQCDECTESDCGWCETSKQCLKPSPHAGVKGPAPRGKDLSVTQTSTKDYFDTQLDREATRHRWHNFRNGPGPKESSPPYFNDELALCPDWHWRSCPCAYYTTCSRCILKGSCSWCLDYPDATGSNGRCVRLCT